MGLLDGRVVIVTGAGRGLGREHALELARAGATVVLNDLNVSIRGDAADEPTPAESVAAEIRTIGGTAVVNGDSVADWNAMEKLIADTVAQFGDLHAIVNNAGFLRDRMIFALTEEDFDSVINVHLKGTFNLVRHACVYWRERAKAGHKVTGRIVNTTSGTGIWGNIGQSNYGAAKAGIAMLTTITALEMERYGVTANSLSPIAATRMLASAGETADLTQGWNKLDPANASPVVAWLCSEESGWVTGQIFRVDGSTVMNVGPHPILGSYTAKTQERLSLEELTAGMRHIFGTAPSGVPQRN